MIIPVRCFTCGKVLADKWAYYQRKCAEVDSDDEDACASATPHKNKNAADTPQAVTPAVVGAGVTARGRILDDLALTRLCCRRHFLTHVDLAN